MARLAVRHVRYFGDQYTYESPRLGDGICILVGPNGSGKTTFSDFIYFALGGRVPKYSRESSGKHVEICNDTNNYVELEIEIDSINYRLRRYVGRNEIGVMGPDGTLHVYHVSRAHAVHDQGVFSDWLLDKLNIQPVTLYQGSRNWKLGFPDLARLIYHDQEPNPNRVFKQPDQDGITETGYVRKAIFEILTGRSFQELYTLHGEVKKLEDEISALTVQQRSFDSAAQIFLGASLDKNTEHLDELSKTLARRIVALEEERNLLTEATPAEDDTSDEVAALRTRLVNLSEELYTLNRSIRFLMQRLSELEDGRVSMLHEATQVEKILYTDTATGLFGADNICPFCYSPIDERPEGHCICGAAVGEGNFQAFFYSSEEYNDILREKRKALTTIEESMNRFRTQLDAAHRHYSLKTAELTTVEDELRKQSEHTSRQLRADRRIARVEKQIRETEKQLKENNQRLKIERERQRILDEQAVLKEQLKRKDVQRRKREIEAEVEMMEIREAFERRYTELLRYLVPTVRVATITDNYEPIMNLGEHVEASARVPFRLLYFAVLLELSLRDPGIPYPRFLLIDTPETAGIDPQNFLKALECLRSISEGEDTAHQIILTTGEGKYPASLEASVIFVLDKQHKLLTPRDPASETE